MTAPASSPSRALRIYATTLRVALWLLAAFWLVLALAWGGLHFVIVPRIEDWRESMQVQASRALGVPVRIGSIAAHSQGLVPSFELREVALLDPQGREALRLPRVLAALSPRSLFRLGFEQLYLEGPELDIRRTAQGHLLVGGLDFSKPQETNTSGAGADWVFSQTEFVIRRGTLRWTDEMPRVDGVVAPPLALTDVDLVLRNPSIALARRHLFRLDATPPADWGQRFTLSAKMRGPALSQHSGDWRQWSGELHSDFAAVDISQLRRYVDLNIDIAQGRGALRAWADVDKGQVIGVVADLGLQAVEARLAPQLDPLALQSIGARMSWREMPGGFAFATEGLQFQTQEGLVWPGGNISMALSGAQEGAPLGELKANKLDLSALALIANRLPLGTTTHALLADFRPQGRVEALHTQWAGPISQLTSLSAKGQVTQLALAAHNTADSQTNMPLAAENDTAHRPGRPGLRGANIDFDLGLTGGRATISMEKGALEFPGAFEDPVIAMDRLSAQTLWTVKGERIDLSVDQIKFANADVQGEASAKWRTSDPALSRSQSRFPGVLDLTASLGQADGTKVHRYLPASILKSVREYVRASVTHGQISSGKVRIRGDLFDLPFADPKMGEFSINAKVQNASFAYVPQSFSGGGTASWPALTQLNGELHFDRVSMQVKGATARFEGLPGLQISKAEASLPSLIHTPTVQISGEARGPVSEVLRLVKTSPLSVITSNVLSQATASGSGDYRIRLHLPLFDLEKTRVQGSVTLAGNDIQFTPSTPLLGRARGQIAFSEKGFQILGAQAAMLGGDIRFEGGSRTPNTPQTEAGLVVFRGQGQATADGLRGASALGLISSLAQRATGSTPYTATLSFRQGLPELAVNTSLVGMGLILPAPMSKNTETALPLRYENRLAWDAKTNNYLPDHDELLVSIGQVASAYYLRNLSGKEPHVVRGGIAVGLDSGESAPAPDEGVVANINLARVDLDAWERVLGETSVAAGATRPAGGASQTYLPTVMAVRAKELKAQGRTLNNVVVGGSRDGLNWRANVDAAELNGYVEYRQASTNNAGRVYARLSRLTLAPAQTAEVEKLLEEQPSSIPALDIVVEDLELRGKKLGRVEVDAVNRALQGGGGREWRLNRLSLSVPEATFSATGNWAAVAASTIAPAVPAASGLHPAQPPARRRTVMNFKFDIADSGVLLTRLGLVGVVRKGKGLMEGQIAWLGSPFALDYPTMGGQFNVNIEEGQFLKADPGIAKLLGVLSLQSLPRRLTLDFRDVFTEGFAFDFVRGDVRIEQGVAITNNLQMKGVNAAVLMEGKADIAKETQDIHVVVVPEINAGTASVIATVINPAVGLGTFLAQLILRRPLIEATKQEFQIDGSWADPRINKVTRKATPAEPARSEAGQ